MSTTTNESFDPDDMVLVPSLGEIDPTSAGERARVQRRTAKQHDRGGLWERMKRAKAARKLARLGTLKGARQAGVGFVRAGRFVSMGGTVGAAAKAATSPMVLGVAAVAAAAIVAARILADRPFEGIGQELNETLLGDLDDDARAAMNVRSYLGQQPHVMAMLATHAGVATHLNRVKQTLHEIEKDRQHGTSVLNQEFPVNGMLDMLILRLWESIGKGAAKHHLAEKLDETTKAYATYATKIMANPNVLSNDRANRMRAR